MWRRDSPPGFCGRLRAVVGESAGVPRAIELGPEEARHRDGRYRLVDIVDITVE